MRHIKVYINDDTKEHVKVPLHFQFYFYYYLPYVLLDDLMNIDPDSVGLFLLNKQNEKITQSRCGQRIYFNQEDNMSVEDGCYVLNCLPARSNTGNIKMNAVGYNCTSGSNIQNIIVHLGNNSDLLATNNGKEEEHISYIRQRKISKK